MVTCYKSVKFIFGQKSTYYKANKKFSRERISMKICYGRPLDAVIELFLDSLHSIAVFAFRSKEIRKKWRKKATFARIDAENSGF